MRLLFVRHGDPDYEHDSLTETGKREAALLVPRMRAEGEIKAFYVSPLGRARETAQPTLEAFGRTAVVKDWLREFPPELDVTGDDFLMQAYPDTPRNADGTLSKSRIVWDMLPSAWRDDPVYYEKDGWRQTKTALNSGMGEAYDRVTAGLDALLAEHGYVRSGGIYRVEQANDDTLAFFCHFGLTSVLLGHLLGISPHVVLHGFALAPTSVTTLNTEERIKGKAIFRAASVGDISHLYAAGEKPSFSARFCTCYDNTWERH